MKRENSPGLRTTGWYSAITDRARVTALSSTNAVLDVPIRVAASRSPPENNFTREFHLLSRCSVVTSRSS
jgi:hypothetical protein